MRPNNRVLFVDDEPAFLRSVARSLSHKFEIVTTTDSKAALSLHESNGPFGVVVSDFKMPGLDGVQYLILSHQCYPETERILMTGYADVNTAISAVNSAKVHSILIKPCSAEKMEQELGAALQKYNSRLLAIASHKNTIDSMGTTIEKTTQRLLHEVQKHSETERKLYTLLQKVLAAKDQYTFMHSLRVAELVRALAMKIGFSKQAVKDIETAGLLHDLGKICVPSEMLSKRESLGELELEVIRYHAQAGYDLLSTVDLNPMIVKAVYQHHERLNGSGYPNALMGNQILLESQLVGVADVVEAITNDRPYRPALGIDYALAVLQKNRGIEFRAEVVDACIEIFTREKFEFAATASDNTLLARMQA